MNITVNNININYIKRGTGAPLLLLHGNGEDHRVFDVLAQRLQEHFTIYALDSRNHGLSQQTKDYGYQSMTEDVKAFIAALNLQHVSILGFSDGAIIAALIAMERSAFLDRIMLLGINLKPSDFEQKYIDMLTQELEKKEDPLLRLMLTQPNIDIDDLAKIACPTLVVHAEDELFDKKLYENIVATIPHARLLVMHGHDHGSYIIDSDTLYEDVVKFMEQ